MNENPHQAQPVRARKNNDGGNKMLIVALVIIVIAGAAFYFKPWERFMAPAAAGASATGAQVPAQTEESLDAIKALSKIYAVPEGDEPIIYTIDDAQSLIAQQAFFTGAINGDTLFIFPKNMKAVIFSQQRNKVINAGPLSYQGDESTTAPATVPTDGQ